MKPMLEHGHLYQHQLDFSAKNSETFGPKIDTALDKFQDFGKVVSQWYPSRDLKIHLQ